MSKNLQSYTLECWWGIDGILFGNKKPKDVLSNEDFTQYLETKSMLLENLYSLYNVMGLEPIQEFYDEFPLQQLMYNGYERAENGFQTAYHLMEQESVLDVVQDKLTEHCLRENVDEEIAVKHVLEHTRSGMAIDAMFFDNIHEDLNAKDFKVETLLDAHKTFRDSLIDISTRIS